MLGASRANPAAGECRYSLVYIEIHAPSGQLFTREVESDTRSVEQERVLYPT